MSVNLVVKCTESRWCIPEKDGNITKIADARLNFVAQMYFM